MPFNLIGTFEEELERDVSNVEQVLAMVICEKDGGCRNQIKEERSDKRIADIRKKISINTLIPCEIFHLTYKRLGPC